MDYVRQLADDVKSLLSYDTQIKKLKDGRAQTARIISHDCVQIGTQSYHAEVATDYAMKPGETCYVQVTKNGTAVVIGGRP